MGHGGDLLLRFAACALALTAPVSAAFSQGLPNLLPANQPTQSANRYDLDKTILKGDDLRRQGIQTVLDALRTVPDLKVRYAQKNGSITEIYMRGEESWHVLVRFDDIPVNRTDFGGFDFADFLIDDIDRIEIERGPNSALYGDRATAGVISIYTRSGRGLKKPDYFFRAEPGSQHGNWFAGGYANHTGRFYGAFSLQNRETKGFNISQQGNEKDGRRTFVFNGKGGVEFSKDFFVEASLRHFDRKMFFDPLAQPLPDGDAQDRFRHTFGRLYGNYRAPNGNSTHRLGIHFDQQDYSSLTPAIWPFPITTSGSTQGADYKGTFRYGLGNTSNTSILVLDQKTQRFTSNLGPSEQRNQFGTAYEHIAVFPFGLTANGVLRQDFHNTFDNFFTWRFALSQKLLTGTRLHASIGKSYTLPGYFDMRVTTPTYLANRSLRPETTTGWEAGIEHSFGDGFFVAGATYFSSRAHNRLTVIDLRPILQAVNVPGTSPRHGVEITGTLRPWKWLTLQAGYTYTDAEDPSGAPAYRQPRHAGTFVTTFHGLGGKLNANVIVTNSSRARDAFFTSGYVFSPIAVTLRSQTLINAIVTYQLTQAAQAYLRADNLLNDRGQDAFSYVSPGAAVFFGLRMSLGDLSPAFP